MAFVIGIDPGTSKMGYGVLKIPGRGQLEYVTCGVCTAPEGWSKTRRLAELARSLEEVVNEVDPNEVVICAIEAGFVMKKQGQMGAIALGEARGIARLVMFRRFGVEVAEFQPATVKLAACGNGAAKKPEVARIVAARLHIPGKLDPDAGDAVAVAIAAAQQSDLY